MDTVANIAVECIAKYTWLSKKEKQVVGKAIGLAFDRALERVIMGEEVSSEALVENFALGLGLTADDAKKAGKEFNDACEEEYDRQVTEATGRTRGGILVGEL